MSRMTEYIAIEDDNVMTHFLQVSLLGWKTAVNDVIGNSDGCVPCYSHVTLKLHFEKFG